MAMIFCSCTGGEGSGALYYFRLNINFVDHYIFG